MRPTRESLHMATAFLWASRSEDPRLKVGCVITTNDMKRVLSVGYNGLAKGRPMEEIGTEPGESGCLHAEDNAIAMCDSIIPSKRIFITHSPCPMCAQRIINAGFEHIYYCLKYRSSFWMKITGDAKISRTLVKPWFPAKLPDFDGAPSNYLYNDECDNKT